MKPLLSILITSYNRPNELRRCIEAIDTKYPNKIEVIPSEDLSPKREEIRAVLEDLKLKVPFELKPNYNESNLGYDRNLNKLISLAKGNFSLLCTDDDALIPGSIDEIIDFLEKQPNTPCLYTAYKSSDNKSTNRRYNHDFIIPKGINSVNKYLMDGILVSGLIFKTSLVKNISSDRFVNLNYYQIYLLMYTLYNYGGYYKSLTLINCIGDGENGYGTTELSKKNPLLANRKSIYSNLEFNKGLVKVIKLFDEDNHTDAITPFTKEFALRRYRGMSAARRQGKTDLRKYWEKATTIGIPMVNPAPIYYKMLMLFGSDLCDVIFELPRKLLFTIRRH
jgi:glycosyltransferase involved in cell wall biosynthesis